MVQAVLACGSLLQQLSLPYRSQRANPGHLINGRKEYRPVASHLVLVKPIACQISVNI